MFARLLVPAVWLFCVVVAVPTGLAQPSGETQASPDTEEMSTGDGESDEGREADAAVDSDGETTSEASDEDGEPEASEPTEEELGATDTEREEDEPSDDDTGADAEEEAQGESDQPVDEVAPQYAPSSEVKDTLRTEDVNLDDGVESEEEREEDQGEEADDDEEPELDEDSEVFRVIRAVTWAQEIVRFSARAGFQELEAARDEEDRGQFFDEEAFARMTFGDEYWTPGALPSVSNRFPEDTLYHELGAYDLGTIRPIFARRGFLPDFNPEGKQVCDIHYNTRDIFVPEEDFPTWLNALHKTTRLSTLETIFQYEVGEVYDERKLRETIQDLENEAVYSTVVALPVVSETEGCVELAVITRDIWSLKAGVDFDISGGTLNNLTIRAVETNLAGLNDTIGVFYQMDQGSFQVGPVWLADWIGGNDLFGTIELRAVFDRVEGGIDGTAGLLQFSQPIRTVRDNTGWLISERHRVATERDYEGSQIRTETVTDPESGQDVVLERQWYETDVRTEASRSWAFGLDDRHILNVGGFLDIVEVDPRPNNEDASDAALQRFKERFLPRQERGLGPVLRYRFFQQKYLERINYREFERTERYRGGFEARAELRYSEEFFGASSRFLEALALATYRGGVGKDGLFEVGALQGVRIQGHISDIRTEGVIRLALPSGLAGRFVSRTFGRRWAKNDNNQFFEIASTTAVRGLGGEVIEGSNAFVQNLEWRSRAVEFWTIRLGGAFFGDVGAVWEPGGTPTWRGSVGFGLRIFAPQFMTGVLSLDVGFEVGTDERWEIGNATMPFATPSLSIRFGQLFEGATDLPLETLQH
jgi:hypothetical protein